MTRKKNLQDLQNLSGTMLEKSEWHQEQTLSSFSKFILEEAREIRSAIRKKDWVELRDEIGDLLWDAVFLSQLAQRQGLFSMNDSLASAHAKVHRRNPHIFGKVKIRNRRELWRMYRAIKRKEKMEKKAKQKRKKMNFGKTNPLKETFGITKFSKPTAKILRDL